MHDPTTLGSRTRFFKASPISAGTNGMLLLPPASASLLFFLVVGAGGVVLVALGWLAAATGVVS